MVLQAVGVKEVAVEAPLAEAGGDAKDLIEVVAGGEAELVMLEAGVFSGEAGVIKVEAGI